MRSNITVLLTIFINSILLSTINARMPDTTANIIEEGWIEKMTNKIAVDVSLNNSYSVFEVKTPSNRILLYPNTPNNLRLKFSYDFISFGIQFSPDFIPGNGDNEKKGKTNSFKIGTAAIFKHWFADIVYKKVRGYYLKNSDEINGWTSRDPYFQFPDLHYSGFTMSSGYIHNSKFSFRHLISQTERQLKSVGSFIPVLDIDYYVIDDKSSDINTQKSNNIELGIGPGYAYTFVFKEKLYFSVGGYTSFGYLKTKLKTRTDVGDIITNQDNFIFRWDAKTGFGYNTNRFYTGLYSTISGERYKQENTTVVNSRTRIYYHFFVGYRFDPPKFFEKFVSRLKKTIP
jgi:hypothetical protein